MVFPWWWDDYFYFFLYDILYFSQIFEVEITIFIPSHPPKLSVIEREDIEKNKKIYFLFQVNYF